MTPQITLSELHEAIKEILYGNFEDRYWIVAEISQLNENKKGHCYLELIEKSKNGKTIAKTRANIWAYTYRHLKSYFYDMTDEQLKAGMKVLVLASVEFHEVYGYSLNIKDIDPTYTLGDQARKRQEIIDQLEEDGVMNMNKEVELTLVPQKIAVISSETAAGYGDFINQLKNNAYNYTFYTKLFPAVMQGENAEESIISALERIYEYEDFFETAVIIRGGGSKEELSCFDNYLMALNIAQYPLPVLTGIGHERDESIADLVSHKKFKTPTAVAEFLIEKAAIFEGNIESLFMKINENYKQIVSDENIFIENSELKLEQFTKQFLANEKNKNEKHEIDLITKLKSAAVAQENKLENLKTKIHTYAEHFAERHKEDLLNYSTEIQKINKFYVQIEHNKLENLNFRLKSLPGNYMKTKAFELNSFSRELKLLSPEQVLKRGYALIEKDKKIVKSVKTLKKNDKIKIKLSDGTINTKVS